MPFHKQLFGGIVDIATGLFPGTIDDKIVERIRGATTGTSGGGCPPGWINGPQGCQPGTVVTDARTIPAPGPFAIPQLPGRNGNGAGAPMQDAFGPAVMGRFGAAIVPAMRTQTVSVCPRGTKLGKDGLCYNRISKRDRKWNPGHRPLATGGEMNTLRKAARIEERLKGVGLSCGAPTKRKKRKLVR